MSRALELLAELEPEEIQASIADLQSQIAGLRVLLKVATAKGKKSGATGSESGSANSEDVAARVATYIEAAGPSTLGEIARGIGIHHKTVGAALRNGRFKELAGDRWRNNV